MPPNRDPHPNREPEVAWHEDCNILVVEGEKFYAEGNPPRADVRVGVLRRLRGNQLPEGLEVQAVRRVAGSALELYADGDCPIFSRVGGRGILLVEEAVVVDEEDEPDPERRASRLRADMRQVLGRLANLTRDGRINGFEAGSEYPEDGLAYWSCTLTVDGLDRGVYEIMTDTPELALLPGHWSDPHPGLTLTFDTRLHRFDATAFDALIAEVLGAATEVTIEERSNLDAEGPAFIRINGSRAEDLVAVAEAFYQRAWRSTEAVVEDRAIQRAMSSGLGLLLVRLDEMRDHLVKVESSTNLFADDEVREAITDKAAEHIAATRERTFSTPLQRIVRGLAKEAPKKLVAGLVGEKAAEALGDVLGGVAEAVLEETMDVLRDPSYEEEGVEGDE